MRTYILLPLKGICSHVTTYHLVMKGRNRENEAQWDPSVHRNRSLNGFEEDMKDR